MPRATWKATAQRFMDLYPNVTVEGTELQYDTGRVYGVDRGQPTSYAVPRLFYRAANFIEQDAVADLTPYIETANIADVFNPAFSRS